jgi:Tol biopolymer transport system component/predicted Ser/Thr protein kinase
MLSELGGPVARSPRAFRSDQGDNIGTLTPERIRQIEELYHAARECEHSGRAALLAQAEPGLRREVESLLAQDSSDGPMERPAVEMAAHLLDFSTATHLTIGAQLGPYKILAPLGAGGMGRVYRGLDTRLGRAVAIKIANQQFSERFEREARAISALNHPNICTLYDVGPNYLVMELVEGETLAARLLKGALPFDLVLGDGVQIAGALAAAHARGIVHRDLKPANIMITKSGIKVLDFGLAKIARPANVPNASEPLTAENAVMGTLGYMAPEQVEGKECDARTDLFALGLILAEMATGKRVITGDSQAALMAAVMNFQPAPIAGVPPQFSHVVERCLERDPEQRWQTASDVQRELEWVAKSQPTMSAGKPDGSRPARRIWALAIALVALLALIAVWLGFAHFRASPPAAAELARFEITLPDKVNFSAVGTFAVSPDGRRLVFAAVGADSIEHLWLRALDSAESQLLQGTENPGTVVWSPDSRLVAFASGSKLKKIDVSGGPPETISDLSQEVIGGSWNRDGVIIFGGHDGIRRVSEAGGGASTVIRTDPARESLSYPTFLPDGKHFVYFRNAAGQNAGEVWLGSLDAKPDQQAPKQLLRADFSAAYAPSSDPRAGYILFMRQDTLLAQAFDLRKLELTGTPIRVAAPVATNPGNLGSLFSASRTGTLIYRVGGRLDRQLTWFNRQGNALGAIGEPGYDLILSLSPDGTRAAVSELDVQTLNTNIWLVDLSRGTKTRFTIGSEHDNFPVWSADGNRIIFRSIRGAGMSFYERSYSGAGSEELLLTLNGPSGFPVDWSRDGRFLLFGVNDPKTSFDLWTLPLDGSRKPVPFLRTEFTETGGQFSPDGRWIAYYSNESGRGELYVQPFDPAKGSPGAGKWMVSKGGALSGHWRRGGKELLYLSPDATVMKVDISVTPAFHAGPPERLFQLPLAFQQARSLFNLGYLVDVTEDGNRFLVAMPMNQPPRPVFNVVLNWPAVLKQSP